MKSTELTVSKLAANVPKAIRDTEARGICGVTRHGRAVVFLLSRDTMESILETMELQKNPQLMRLVKQHKAGKLKFYPVPDED